MKKKVISAVLSVSMVAALAVGCGSTETKTTEAATTAASEKETTAATTEAASEAATTEAAAGETEAGCCTCTTCGRYIENTREL